MPNTIQLCLTHRATNTLLLVALSIALAAFPALARAEAEAPSGMSSTDEMRSVSGELGERSSLPGAELFTKHCANCHNGQVYKAPHTTWLEMMPARSIYRAMDGGIMSAQAASLSEVERVHVVEYLLQERFTNASLAANYNMCEGEAAAFAPFNASELTGWGRDTSRFVPDSVAQLAVADIPRLKMKWSFGFPGAMRARSQPTVAMGAIFVGSQDGTVYALDLQTGCVRWAYEASAEVRTGITLGQHEGDPATVYFGDIIANVYAVDATTGELRWKIAADDHHSATLTGTPAYHEGNVYVPVSSLEVIAAANPDYECCSFRGKVIALDGADGSTRWESYSIPQEPAVTGKTAIGTAILSPSGGPVWTSPTIDAANNILYFGTGENYSSPADDNSDAIVAVRLDTGERIWRHQVFAGDAWNVACMMADNPNCPKEDGPDFDQGSSPLLVQLGGGKTLLVAGHKDGSVLGYDPNGKVEPLWKVRVGRGSIQGGVHFGMAAEGTRIYAPINDMNDTRNGDILDPEAARPGVHAIDAVTGKVLWSHVQKNVCDKKLEFCDPGVSAPVTAIPGAVIAGHLDGYIRIYDGETGKVLLEYDTAQAVTTVNGVPATGGSMSGAGPTVAQGHVISNSGYGLYSHEPGNIMVVLSVDGK
ncbi:MAG: PQQ-binding-like beta-propeller repeat protein [Halioglobus sp.]